MSSRSFSHTSSCSRMSSSWDSASRAESGQPPSRGDDMSPSAEEENIMDNIARNAQAESTPLHRLSSLPPDRARTHTRSAAWTERMATAAPEAVMPLPPSAGDEHDASVQAVPRTGDEAIGVRRGAGGKGRHDPFPRTRFGLNADQLRGQASKGAPRDYKQKYAEDPPYRELVPDDARVWLVYNDESTIFDNDMIVESGDNLDILLLFAGLFSAVLTTFVAQTSQALSPDNTAISNSILLELVALQRAKANGTSFDSIPAADISFTMSSTDIWVNGLWFTSLALSLSTALLAVLAKQWLRQYSSFIAGSARTRALIRQFRYACFDKWGVRLIISLLPTVLHLSLFLFKVGLVVFLFPLNRTLARVVACITGFLCGIYIITHVLPILTIKCPYRTPISAVLYPFARALTILVIKVTVFIVKIPYTFVRGTLGYVGLMGKRGRWLFPTTVTIPKRMGESLQETERAHVEDEDKQWTNMALSWLARTTSDPSANAILVEALGAEGAEDPLLDHDVLPIFTQQWANTASRLMTGESGSLGNEMTLGRLIRATMLHDIYIRPDCNPRPLNLQKSSIRIMLDNLPTTPISAADPTTILAIAACSRTSRFAWSDKPEGDVLAPYKAFDFVLEHYAELDELVAPTWMWWSICTQAAIGPEWLDEESHGRTMMLIRICKAKKKNIERYDMMAWLEQLSVSVDLQRAVEACLRKNDGCPPYSPVSLAKFLAVYFPGIWKRSSPASSILSVSS
ncbi:hypothetical protein DFH08DRAFT_836464 [Mycena albidolilacea]|uniref:DUF6535 domain-containing protein n=1 Tax=Mycena albidolilacea TaxID=1033008 RepID=A0AAD7ASA7_9AGAR|nr:hypothetical protein DFH08DRAFT_836464 [Mycena albidolilacea]